MHNQKIRKLVIAVALCTTFLFTYLKSCKHSDIAKSSLSTTKYIGCSAYEAGGLGNQLWRFMALYGIGRYTNRLPYFVVDNFQTSFTSTDLHLVNLTEIAEIFPFLHEELEILSPPADAVEYVYLATDCCIFESPKSLINHTEKYLKISGSYLQSYKYFSNYTTETKQFLSCADSIVSKVNKSAEAMFKHDTSHKLCVHIRRGDFLTDLMLESKSEFVTTIINEVHKYFSQRNYKNISLVFLGDDPDFQRALKFNKQNFVDIYYANFGSRGKDMCFGINFCDSVILTASGSTFGWWISYLKKNQGPVFYNSQVTDYGNHTKDIYYYDLFPPEWIRVSISGGFVNFL